MIPVINKYKIVVNFLETKQLKEFLNSKCKFQKGVDKLVKNALFLS